MFCLFFFNLKTQFNQTLFWEALPFEKTFPLQNYSTRNEKNFHCFSTSFKGDSQMNIKFWSFCRWKVFLVMYCKHRKPELRWQGKLWWRRLCQKCSLKIKERELKNISKRLWCKSVVVFKRWPFAHVTVEVLLLAQGRVLFHKSVTFFVKGVDFFWKFERLKASQNYTVVLRSILFEQIELTFVLKIGAPPFFFLLLICLDMKREIT